VAGKKQRLSLPAAVLIVITAAAMVFLLYQQLGSLKAARQQRAGEQQALTQTRQHLRQLENTRDHAAMLQQQIDVLEQAIPPRAGEDELIEYMQMLADDTGTGFVEIIFADRSSRQGYIEMPFTVSFQGSYQRLLELMGELQYGRRVITVDELKIGRGQSEMTYLRADITCKTYYKTK
jgi:Tfp pilus assembly protein PilO